MKPSETIAFKGLKAYRSIRIQECGEPLVPLPRDIFAFFDPPPYVAFGATYGNASPWMVRKGVLDALRRAQAKLEDLRPGWKILFFDAYRPREVQTYMVNREFGIKAREAGLDPEKLTEAQHEELALKVFKYWAIPSDDPKTPPPHSTGAAIDVTLADEHGLEVDMGSPIDEGAPPSDPLFFASASDAKGKQAHANRLLLHAVMHEQGFHQHPNEWWHFSNGDQIWANLEHADDLSAAAAIYGRADLVGSKAS